MMKVLLFIFFICLIHNNYLTTMQILKSAKGVHLKQDARANLQALKVFFIMGILNVRMCVWSKAKFESMHQLGGVK